MRYLILAALFMITATANAQSYPKMYTFKSTQQSAMVLPLPNTTDIAEETILNKLRSTGYKPQTKGKLFWKKNKQEGFYIFPGVQLPELNHQKLDLYFKVDPVKNDPSIQSNVILIVSKGQENFITPQADSTIMNASQDFLNSFVSETASFKLNKDVETEKSNVQASEKKLKDLKERQDDARKKITQLEEDIKKWQDEEAKESVLLDSSKNTLGTLQSQTQPVATDSAK